MPAGIKNKNYIADCAEDDDEIVSGEKNPDCDMVYTVKFTGDIAAGFNPDDELKIIWDKNHDFSETVQTYQDDTDFKLISENFSKYILNKNRSSVSRSDVDKNTLLTSQKIAHDIIVRIATRDFGFSSTDVDDCPEFGRLLILCGKGDSGKSYTIDCILDTVSSFFERI